MRTLRLGRSADAVLHRLVGLAAPDQLEPLAEARRVGRHHGWAGAPGFRRRPWGPGWALVGDAGYYKDPISTHGMTDALRDAELLARALLAALGGGDEAYGARRVPPAPRHRVPAPPRGHRPDRVVRVGHAREVQRLLRRLSAAMTDEVELLESLPAPAGALT